MIVSFILLRRTRSNCWPAQYSTDYSHYFCVASSSLAGALSPNIHFQQSTRYVLKISDIPVLSFRSLENAALCCLAKSIASEAGVGGRATSALLTVPHFIYFICTDGNQCLLERVSSTLQATLG